MGLPRQEYWSGLPFPSPGDLFNPEIEPESPDLAGFFTAQPPGKPNHILNTLKGNESSEKEVITSRKRLRSTSYKRWNLILVFNKLIESALTEMERGIPTKGDRVSKGRPQAHVKISSV